MEISVQGLPEDCEVKPGDVKQVARRVLTREKVDCELAVIFVDDATMSSLNYKYTKREGPTDV
ncbi:MAG: rRNA maturation RNAse YbeY, partial [bacterium]